MKKIISVFISLIAMIYSLYYASLGGFVGNEGALSKIGLYHPVLFAIWGLLTAAAIDLNITIGFLKTKYKFHYILICVSLIAMIMTISFDFDYSNYTQYMLHCIGSMTFSIITGVNVFLLFF